MLYITYNPKDGAAIPDGWAEARAFLLILTAVLMIGQKDFVIIS